MPNFNCRLFYCFNVNYACTKINKYNFAVRFSVFFQSIGIHYSCYHQQQPNCNHYFSDFSTMCAFYFAFWTSMASDRLVFNQCISQFFNQNYYQTACVRFTIDVYVYLIVRPWHFEVLWIVYSECAVSSAAPRLRLLVFHFRILQSRLFLISSYDFNLDKRWFFKINFHF